MALCAGQVQLALAADVGRAACLAEGVSVGRDFPPYEDRYCRVSIGTMDEMQRAVAVFKTVLGGATSTSRQQARG